MAKEAERKARDGQEQARKQAEHDVAYFTEFLAREKVRAKAIVQFAGATEDEAADVVREAEDKLAAAMARLEALH